MKNWIVKSIISKKQLLVNDLCHVPCAMCHLKPLLIFILICGLLTLDYGLLYSQDDHLTIKGNTEAHSLTFSGNLTAYPAAPLKGELFYNSQAKLPKYFDGSTWKDFGGPKTVATRIVAAANTPNGASRADYVCDGTDDQHDINQAINSLPAGGGAVYLLEGTYNICATPLPNPPETLSGIVPHSNTALIGTGRGTVLKVVSDASRVNVINAVGTQSTPLNGILISQLMIDGNSKTGSNNNGIAFTAVTNSKIDKVWVENMISEGIYFNSSSQNTISNNDIAVNYDGIQLDNASRNNTISHNHTENNVNYGIVLSAWECNYNIISHNDVENNDYGIRIGSSSNNIVSHNNIHHNTRIGISLNTAPGNIISNNNIHHNTGVDTGVGINVYNTSGRTIISNNNINNNRRQGITATASASDIIITGNVFYDNGGADANSAIELSSSYNIISSNRIYDSTGTGYGINIAGSNNYLIGNLIDGTTGTNPTGYYNPLATPPYDHRIQDLGTNTKYTDKTKITLERQALLSVSNDATITPTGPASYVPVVGNGGAVTANANTPIAAGKAAGDILILEGTDNTNTVTIPDSGVNLEAARALGQYDILKLIWNGSRWLEMEFVDN